MINTKDKRLIALTGVCVSIIFLFWAFVYFPANKKLQTLKMEFDNIKKEISGIGCLDGKEGHDIKKMVESLQKDLKYALQKLPSQEEDALRLLSSEANRLGIEIVSISPRPKRPYIDTSSNPVFLEDEQCFEMPILIEMRGLYKAIGGYLNILRESYPALVKAEDIRIQRDEAISPRLSANLELVLYLACPKE